MTEKALGRTRLREKELHHCLEQEEMELYLLNQELDEELKIPSHIDNCFDCYIQFFELQTFHLILNSELRKPISNQIKNLVKDIQNN